MENEKFSRDRIREEVREANRNSNLSGVIGGLSVGVSVVLLYFGYTNIFLRFTDILWYGIVLLVMGLVLLFAYAYYYMQYKRWKERL